MNRAMFSGVAGLKTHQTKMDVIGNNIANVNTYGFKSQRAVFSDIFYQTLKSASGGTTSRGGTNPSSVGYGSTLAAIQTQMSQSSMQNTGFGLDVAITGEGFFQVMDADGNIFYTKAGLLDYDSNGYLTDINGNFVLGAGSADGTPGTQKIRLDNVGSVEAAKPSVTETINGVNYTITASNATKYGNVGISIGSSTELPDGLPAVATISNSGAITVQLNAYHQFASMSELNSAINAAVKEANGGKEHAAGTFTITASENKFGKDAVSGTFTGSATNQAAQLTAAATEGLFGGALSIKAYDLAAIPASSVTQPLTMTKIVAPVTGDVSYKLSMTVEGVTYEQTIPANIAEGAVISLQDITTPSAKRIDLAVDSKSKLTDTFNLLAGDGDTTTSNVNQTPPQYFFGGSKITGVSTNFAGQGNINFTYSLDAVNNEYTINAVIGGKTYTGTVSSVNGGTCTLSTGNADDGTITMSVPTKAAMLNNYGINPASPTADTDLATAANASLAGHNYVAVPYAAGVSSPLTGAEIAGIDFGVSSGTITGTDVEDGYFGGGLTFMKTSSDFTGSGTVGSGDFYATYSDTTPPSWTITMNVGGTDYSATITENTKASSLLLKSAAGDYIQVTNPGFEAMNDYYTTLNPSTSPVNGSTMSAITGGKDLTVGPATASRDLGFSSVTFNLTGGAEGGVVTLDQLSSIGIGSDGTISVSHPSQGTVVVGKISLATFANPSGLALEGSNYYSKTANSGDAKLCDPGSDGTGALKSSSLEMSNVDLSSEFAEMITTQRGFQANSRVITVSDTMLEELINLKR
ncbi:MAG: flagellar hook-basal body complex protein [Peptococcaceae bacterium]|nr:flagellar hook-basal body complex protein [Peptococcaceae bacterium]